MNLNYKEKLLEKYLIGRSAIGKKIKEIAYIDDSNMWKNKGRIGNLIQEYLFNVPINNISGPDFQDLGLELKVIPLKRISNNKIGEKYNINIENMNNIYCTPKERMVLNHINYNTIVQETFSESSFLKKNKLLQIMIYLHDYNKDQKDFKIIDSFIVDIEKQKEFEIIKKDWNLIVDKIKKGLAHEISESDTSLLSACTKGANKDSKTTQPFSTEKAKSRAFAFKTKFIEDLLIRNRYRYDYFEEIFTYKKEDYLKSYTIDDIRDKLDLLKGINVSKYETNRSKSSHVNAVMKILKNKFPEIHSFIKHNNIKIICKVTNKGKIQEQIGTKYDIDPSEMINETFESSTFFQEVYLPDYIIITVDKQTRIIEDNLHFKFKEEHFKVVESFYNDTKKEIKRLFSLDNSKKILPNFITKKDDRILHVRPHSKNAEGTYSKNKSYGINLNITIQEVWIDKEMFKKR